MDDILKSIGIVVVSKCWCCTGGMNETLDHLFLTSPIAFKLWEFFVNCTSFKVEGQLLFPLIHQWWNFVEGLRGNKILRSIPVIIMWEIWKHRNCIRHGKLAQPHRLIQNCSKTLQMLMKVNNPQWTSMPKLLRDCFYLLQTHGPILQCQLVQRKAPNIGWVKCNTDGASKDNLGLSSYGFCIKDHLGDLIYVESSVLGVCTSTFAKATTILKGLTFCISRGRGKNGRFPGKLCI